MSQSEPPPAIAGATPAVLAVSATALIFLSNAEMAFVPALQVTDYRYVLYGLIAVMVAHWVEMLWPRFMGPRDDDDIRPGVALHFAAGVSPRGWRVVGWLWRGALTLAVLLAVGLGLCAGLGRRGVAVQLDFIELGLLALAWPTVCLFVGAAVVRWGWVKV